MNVNLVRKLVTAGVIRTNTEIEAEYRGIDLSGRPMIRSKGHFFIQGVKIVADEVIFDTVSVVDGSPRKIKADSVLFMDGMPINKLASIHGISDKGDKLKEGKRRGRKPKNREASAT